jgi:hypothetical protein
MGDPPIHLGRATCNKIPGEVTKVEFSASLVHFVTVFVKIVNQSGDMICQGIGTFTVVCEQKARNEKKGKEPVMADNIGPVRLALRDYHTVGGASLKVSIFRV